VLKRVLVQVLPLFLVDFSAAVRDPQNGVEEDKEVPPDVLGHLVRRFSLEVVRDVAFQVLRVLHNKHSYHKTSEVATSSKKQFASQSTRL